ncbi:ATP-binding protein [Yersinia mollaretii]|uniref:ATP-binding protein n=1 Tax=Yersinia mollaretii TaxID=33060 RepID=UPI00005F8243|nr:ATP-binding protein [Yersinia mollaretii]QKJ02817.1 response regulator [Yersinia mollaretii ATCC 43969]
MKYLYKIYLICALLLLPAAAGYAAKTIAFTPEEQHYIKTHPIIKYGVFPKFFPIEALNKNGEHIGLTRDYIDLISAATGIQFQVSSSSNANESVKNLKNGDISLITSTSALFAEANGLVSSMPIFTTWPVTVTRRTSRNINTPEDFMEGRTEGRISITDYLSLIDWFEKRYPGVDYKIAYSPEETIGEVVHGRAAAAVVLSPTAFYYMNVIYPGQLKVSYPNNAKISLVMGARPEDQLLIDIINKVITSISHKQQAELTTKWIISDNASLLHNTQFERYAYIVGAILLSLLLFVFYRYRRLKKEISLLGSKNNLELSVLAHELRTPLIGILTACEGLVLKISSNPQRERLSNVVHVTRELLNNLDLSLDYAKINAGSVQQKPRPHLLTELCDTTVKLFTSFAETHDTALHVRYLSEQCFLPHLMDGTLISQALNNIVNNAIKHTRGGMVLIECALVQIDSKRMFSIEVTDTGTGISDKVLARLSEPFYQGKQHRSDNDALLPKGTGLGLFVAKKNIHLIGGHLGIASQPGVGSRVRISFPMIPAHYEIENPLPEGLYVIMPEDVPTSRASEVTQILEGCELPYYPQSNSPPASARGPVIYLHFDLRNNHWQLDNQQGVSIVIPCPIYASALYFAITSLCSEDLLRENSRTMPEADSASATKESRRLLMVEDEPLLLEVQQELFSSLGYQVDAVPGAQEAYQSWLQHHHTIIVTDCRLDESDGFELVRHLRKLMQETTAQVLIVGQSASLKAEDAQRAREVGMDYLLQKPIAREQWQQLFHDHFASEEKSDV